MALLDRPGFQFIMRLGFWLALAGAVVLALIPQPPDLGGYSMGDKFNHMLAFATLTFLANLGFPAADRWRTAERLSLVGALIEVVQALPGLGRDCDIRDWAADTAAIVAVTLALAVLLPRLRRTPLKR